MSVLDIQQLLSEIAAAAPCGEDLEYDPAFAEMEKLAQETPERQYGDTIIPAEPPDWRGVQKSALTLMERTRDLRVAVCLTRALLQVESLTGFAEDLKLVDGLIERFWEHVQGTCSTPICGSSDPHQRWMACSAPAATNGPHPNALATVEGYVLPTRSATCSPNSSFALPRRLNASCAT